MNKADALGIENELLSPHILFINGMSLVGCQNKLLVLNIRISGKIKAISLF